ncbi:hypothetical protein K439DRAFT_1619879 [Ramaria rubella]|nr:hypothetical protein K439DRAFT_1619879 [Ramaria rubella]
MLSILSRIAIIMVLTAQIYAIYNRNRIVLVVLGTLGLSILVLDILEAVLDDCALTELEENIFHFRELLSSIFQLMFSALVMALSLYRAYGMVATLGGIKNAFTESRFKLMWLIIVEGSRRVFVSHEIQFCDLLFMTLQHHMWTHDS